MIFRSEKDIKKTAIRSFIDPRSITRAGVWILPYTDWIGRLTDADREIVYSVLEKIGALPLADRRYLHLSDGEKQKILIARALAQQTPILFLDEPTAFLDWPNRVETLLLLKEIAVSEKKAVLFSSHDLELVMRFAGKQTFGFIPKL